MSLPAVELERLRHAAGLAFQARPVRSVRVMSHPRAGSHYLAALLDRNLFDCLGYLRIYGGHAPGALWQLERGRVTVYIYRRDLDAVERSAFLLRRRFGLGATDDFDAWRRTPCRDLWRPRLPSTAYRRVIPRPTETIHEVDGLLSQVGLTFRQYVELHRSSWAEVAAYVAEATARGATLGWADRPYLEVAYEDLQADRDGTLAPIARLVGSSRTSFEDVETRVGWWA